MTGRISSSREPLVLLVLAGLVLIVSGIRPFDRATWWLEVAPVLIGAPALVATFSRFRLSPLLYRLLFLHAVILMVGGHYSYARGPRGLGGRVWLVVWVFRSVVLEYRAPILARAAQPVFEFCALLATLPFAQPAQHVVEHLGGARLVEFVAVDGEPSNQVDGWIG